MKFKLLAIGDKFEYQGETFVKTSPIIASNVTSNHNKMIPGYMSVTLLNQAGDKAEPAKQLSNENVMAAFNEFYSSCLAFLDDKTVLEDARDRFIKKLSE